MLCKAISEFMKNTQWPVPRPRLLWYLPQGKNLIYAGFLLKPACSFLVLFSTDVMFYFRMTVLKTLLVSV